MRPCDSIVRCGDARICIYTNFTPIFFSFAARDFFFPTSRSRSILFLLLFFGARGAFLFHFSTKPLPLGCDYFSINSILRISTLQTVWTISLYLSTKKHTNCLDVCCVCVRQSRPRWYFGPLHRPSLTRFPNFSQATAFCLFTSFKTFLFSRTFHLHIHLLLPMHHSPPPRTLNTLPFNWTKLLGVMILEKFNPLKKYTRSCVCGMWDVDAKWTLNSVCGCVFTFLFAQRLQRQRHREWELRGKRKKKTFMWLWLQIDTIKIQ